MSVSIKGGNTGNEVNVTEEFELEVRSINESELEHVSAVHGLAFSWDSGEQDIDVNDTMLFVKSSSDTSLILDRVIVNGGSAVCKWEMYIGADTTVPVGTDAEETNMNEIFSTTPSDAIALYDETAVADGKSIGRVKTAISETIVFNLDGVVLGKGHYFQIVQREELLSGSAILVGHFANPS